MLQSLLNYALSDIKISPGHWWSLRCCAIRNGSNSRARRLVLCLCVVGYKVMFKFVIIYLWSLRMEVYFQPGFNELIYYRDFLFVPILKIELNHFHSADFNKLHLNWKNIVWSVVLLTKHVAIIHTFNTKKWPL